MRSKFAKLLVVTAAALALSLCLFGCGGSSADPSLGKYEGTTCNFLGEEMELAEVYDGGENFIELKANNEAVVCLDGSSIAASYTLASGDLNIIIEDGGEKYNSPGTLEGGVITIDFLERGNTLCFQKAS